MLLSLLLGAKTVANNGKKTATNEVFSTSEPLPIPAWKFNSISMDFVIGLPYAAGGLNAVWIIVDHLTKVARFIPMKKTWSMERMAEAYSNEIIRLHRVPREIVSDRDPRFLSRYKRLLVLS